jgi:peptidyl-prolyl cis-trans isomerase SurA
MIRTILAILSMVTLLVPASAPAQAQQGNPFAAVAIVNDRPITNFELEQRIIILGLFRTPGNLRERALEGLIEDRLRMEAAARMGIAVTEDAALQGMSEFSGRVNMDLDTFLDALNAEGVATQTYRAFITSGIAWREVVNARFGPRTEVTDAEIDRALALSGRSSGAEVLLAEIILPMRSPEEATRSENIAQDISDNVRTQAAFAAAARQYSASPTATRGGRNERYVALGELPPPLRAEILTLAPGEVTTPLTGGNAMAVFQLIDLRETGVTEPTNVALEYAVYLIPGGRSQAALTEAAQIAGRTDTCDDLYGINKGQSPDRLVIETRSASEVPQDIALELAKLDPGEVSTALTRGPNLAMLMLCGRTPVFAEGEEPNRTAVRRALVNERIESYGAAYLEQLRSEAIIRYP